MILNVVKNELYKMRRQKTMFFITLLMLILVIVRVIELSNDANITVNGQTLPIIVIFMDITQYTPLLIVILIADIFTEDYRAGTLKLSLMRPVSRFELIAGKFISLAIFLLILNLATVLGAYIAGTISGGWGEGFSLPEMLMRDSRYSLLNDLLFNTLKGISATIGSMLLETFVQMGFAAVIILLGLCLNSLIAVLALGISLYAVLLIAMNLLSAGMPVFLISQTYDICLVPLGLLDSNDIIMKSLIAILYIGIFFALSVFYLKKKDILT